MQKVCETIGLFNAEYLAVSDISINTHTHTISATGADYIIKMRGHPRQYTAFLAIGQGRPHCFLSPELNIFNTLNIKDIMMKRITSIKTLAARAAVTLLLALLTTVVGGGRMMYVGSALSLCPYR